MKWKNIFQTTNQHTITILVYTCAITWDHQPGITNQITSIHPFLGQRIPPMNIQIGYKLKPNEFAKLDLNSNRSGFVMVSGNYTDYTYIIIYLVGENNKHHGTNRHSRRLPVWTARTWPCQSLFVPGDRKGMDGCVSQGLFGFPQKMIVMKLRMIVKL